MKKEYLIAVNRTGGAYEHIVLFRMIMGIWQVVAYVMV